MAISCKKIQEGPKVHLKAPGPSKILRQSNKDANLYFAKNLYTKKRS